MNQFPNNEIRADLENAKSECNEYIDNMEDNKNLIVSFCIKKASRLVSELKNIIVNLGKII